MIDDFQGWERRDEPPTLFRRFAFAQYAQTRAFLDALSALSEEIQRHPQNINFGTTYVNITIGAADGALKRKPPVLMPSPAVRSLAVG